MSYCSIVDLVITNAVTNDEIALIIHLIKTQTFNLRFFFQTLFIHRLL